MARGKKIQPPKVVVKVVECPKFETQDKMWEAVGPVLARIIAQTILREKKRLHE